MLAATALLTLGCVGQQTTDADPADAPPQRPPLTEKVTLADLVPADQRNVASQGGDADLLAHHLIVQRILFRREAPRLKLVTDTLKPPPIDPAVLANWRANGFGVGEIDRGALPLLLANTPASLGSSLARHTGPSEWVPLITLEKVVGAHRVQYVEPDGTMRIVTQKFGHQQMLLRFERSAEPPDGAERGPLCLSLLPHHYRAAISLQPRAAHEKMLDGTPWYDLRITEPPPIQRAWVVWANLPQAPSPTAPQPDAAAQPDADAGRPAAEPAPIVSSDQLATPSPSADPPRPLTLAEAMLTGMQGNDPVQIVLVIYVEAPPTQTVPTPKQANP